MYRFIFADNRVITTNDVSLPKKRGIPVVRVYVRSEITGKFVRRYDIADEQER